MHIHTYIHECYISRPTPSYTRQSSSPPLLLSDIADRSVRERESIILLLFSSDIDSFGVVFSSHWRGIKVAVKQVKAEYVDEHQVREFLHEVAVMQNLRPHPYVVLFMGITLPPSPLSIVT